ncbi:peptide chain release factor N(5)-glutamine methyltransferase [Candidatus Gracilibacteria bacterium]|nr:peptide chain release factor N(5)-glutamine methyltransferase [Candidatus Gracilibacteria bacterium]
MKISQHIHKLLLQKITGLNKDQLFFNPPPNPLPSKEGELYDNYIKRYLSGEPIEYIVENAEFYGFDFFVDSRVLIPRNDTEIMVEKTIEELKGKNNSIYIDTGTGSGCIPISVVKNITPPPSRTPLKKGRENIQYFGVDISEKALEVAHINMKRHSLEGKITLLQGNLLEPFLIPRPNPLLRGEEKKDIIITANLPYIKQDDFDNMDSSVYLHEPELALYGGKETGFELYEKLLEQSSLLAQEGLRVVVFIEIGFDQKETCEKYLKSKGYEYEIFKDNGGIERCVRIEVK